MGIDPAEHAENDIDATATAARRHRRQDGDPGQATGNPGAAGADG